MDVGDERLHLGGFEFAAEGRHLVLEAALDGTGNERVREVLVVQVRPIIPLSVGPVTGRAVGHEQGVALGDEGRGRPAARFLGAQAGRRGP